MTVRGAIDIGGTKMAVGLVDGDRVVIQEELPTQAEAGPQAAVDRLAATLGRLAEQAGGVAIREIGIACAGPVNVQTGRIENPYSLPGWETTDFTAELRDRCGARVVIENDVAVALLGLLRRPEFEGRNIVLAMFGTGVGISVSMQGRLFRNRLPYHPEFGSLVLRGSGPRDCICGREACVESLLSGPALHRRAQAAGFPDFATACEEQKPEALTLQQRVREELHMLANTFAIIFQPEVFCIGGGAVRAAPDLFREGIASAFREEYHYIAPAEVRLIEDRVSSLVGAAALCDVSMEGDRE